MGFLQSIREKAMQFMYGRNGIDRMNRSLVWLYLILYVASIFLAPEGMKSTAGLVMNAILMLILAVVAFRAFSKNLPKRRRENQAWISFWWKFRTGSTDAKSRYTDRDHKYFICKSCQTTCRVPAGKGKIVITCPKCGAKIQAET